ncbi:glycoside hydrolase family 3 protein [Oceanicoccus sp. KOV_DT_Chl]|uniref:glycoside hydrolase family 3 protein n=1 Tax=Oceanicoccus sp. KOV_DT_Chl TaxID=1904639 RepID=UPI00190E9445|nr:glycoside hydrolase family 3 protein [Oceanicoccus sp. KOV_DT_Chl]
MKYLTTTLLCLLGTLLIACDSDEKSISEANINTVVDEQSTSAVFKFDPAIWPEINHPITVDPELENRISKLMATMSLRDKIGQMIQGETRSVTADDVKKYRLGSVLNGGGTTPNNDKHAKVSDWVDLAQSYYEASMDTSEGGVAIPIIWGTDAVHGHNNVIGATIFPHNIGLGAANDPALIEKIGSATSKEVSATGIGWIFAPTLAVVRDDRWGRTYESYSEAPDIVAAYAEKIVEGLQGVAGSSDFLDDTKTIATSKHYLGDGGTEGGIDQGDNIDDEKTLRDIHAAGYFTALEAGVQTVMASFSSWHGDKMHGQKYLLTDVLKGTMGFDGFVVGDWNGHGQVAGCNNKSCAQSINAGIDMFMVPEDWKALFENTLQQAESGAIPMARVDDAVRRILRVKMRAGLFDRGGPITRPYSNKTELIGAAEHRDIAREAVRKSLVLLKNDGNILPIKANSKVLVVGAAADNIGKQAGGWTISWQGNGNSNEDFPGGSSILGGIRVAVEAAGGQVVYAKKDELPAEGEAKFDVVIAVYGENPYAEMHGDISTLEYQPGNKTDLALLKKVKVYQAPVVSLFISGRPLWVNPELNQSDAFVAVWLPGTEAKGIADVLFKRADGSVNYDFQGRLSFSWPNSPEQLVNIGDDNYSPLFPYGYGLSYAATNTETVGNNLSEEGAADSAAAFDEIVLFDKEPPLPWQLYLHEQGDNSIKITRSYQQGLFNTITVKATDRKVQEDVRRVTWSGERTSEVYVAVNSPMDFSPYQENGVLAFDIKVNKPLAGKLKVLMKCGDNCAGGLAINRLLNSEDDEQWKSVSVALKCFTNEGVNIANITSGFLYKVLLPLKLSLVMLCCHERAPLALQLSVSKDQQ